MIITDIQKEVSGCKVRKSLWDSEIYTYSVSGCQSDRGTSSTNEAIYTHDSKNNCN